MTTAGKDYQAQVLQPVIVLTAGQPHTLKFAARASSNRSIRAAVQKNSAPYPTYFQQTIPITTTWQTYTVTFTPAADDPRALFALNIGSLAGQIWLDDMSLTIPPPPPPPSNGEPPTPVIDLPLVDTTYRAGDVINFSGSATDPEDGALDPSQLTWEVLFHHDTHTHPYLEPFSGDSSGSFVASTGEASANVWYRIHLTATDSDGNQSEVTRDVMPIKSSVTLATQPPGLSLALDGSPVTAPYSFTGVVNFERELGAPASQTVGGTTYNFVSWSDGGAAIHTIATPETDTTFTAVYEAVPNTNLFGNAGFENSCTGWLAPWKNSITSPAKATFTSDTTSPASGVASLQVAINTSSPHDWYVQLLQPNVSLVAGVTHTLTFSARASTARTIRLAFQQNSPKYPIYYQVSFAITTSWQTYSVTFTPPVTNAKALFNVNIATSTGSVWLDDFSLTR